MAEDQDRQGDTVPVAGTELVIERLLNAPRDLVWQAWTEPERLMLWWGPSDSAMTVNRLDLFPGGLFHYVLRSMGGQETWGRFVYVEVAAPEKLVFINSFSDESGGIMRNPRAAAWPMELFNICLFKGMSQKTLLTMKSRPHHATDEERKAFIDNWDNVRQSFTATLDQLDQYLASIHN